MLRYQRIEEFQINDQQQQAINRLLQEAFDSYPNHLIYANQLPSFRFLVWDNEKLVGHMAVEFRIVRVGEAIMRIFGIADLCVSIDYQQQNIASSLLQKLEKLGKQSQVDFILLIAQDHGVYEKNGFQLVSNPCRWLMINQQQTFGVGNRKLVDCLLVKQIGITKWQEGLVDLLGHIF
jgi:predicted N-acetyltransferase YhbS